MKIYTKTGDDGSTGLFGGARVRKDHPRVEAYGTVDELNACLGIAATCLGDAQLKTIVLRLQSELFVLGADLATPLDAPSSSSVSSIPRITSDMTARLESEIDSFSDEVGPITTFILPGGALAAAHLHLARTICRRAERCINHLSESETLNSNVPPYINRLADHLFDLARLVNHRQGVSEPKWSRQTRTDIP